MSRTLDVVSTWAGSALRLGAGLIASHAGARPKIPVELYEFEGCPYCRKVREALTMLDLQAVILPCPKDGPTYREEVKRRGGKAQFPYFVDPNTGDEMYESADIIEHLYEHYGNRSAPFWLRSDVSIPLGSLVSALRPRRGSRYQAARQPEKHLELYSMEASPYCRIAREALCELELPYLLHNVGKRSASRPAFRERSGRMMVPWLVDPNTGVEMFESAAIRTYLFKTYAA